MMRFLQRTLLVGLLLAGLVSADRHPLHLSSATLVQTSKNQWTLKKTLFTDDLEEAMTAMGYEPIRLSDVAHHQAKVQAYLDAYFSLYKGSGDPKNAKPIAWTMDALTSTTLNPSTLYFALRPNRLFKFLTEPYSAPIQTRRTSTR